MINLDLIEKNDKILCALSGGADSVAMVFALKMLEKERNIEVFACHLNHKTRNGESDRDAKFVEELCEKNQIPLFLEEISIDNTVGLGFEAKAREIRYDFFSRAKNYFKATKIATAHNKNDNLETILLNIARGTGLNGLSGIPMVRQDIIRPILHKSREEIEEFLQNNNLSYVLDSSNNEDIYARNKIRHDVIPKLLEINSSAINNAYNMSNSVKTDNDYLNSVAKSEFERIFSQKNGEFVADVYSLLEIHSAIRFRVIDLVVSAYNETLTFKKYHEIIKICQNKNPSFSLKLYNTLEIFRNYGTIVFRVSSDLMEKLSMVQNFDEIIVNTNSLEFDDKTYYVDRNLVDLDSIFVGHKQEGDRFYFSYGSKSLKKLFIERKIPQKDRENLPILRDKNGIIAISFIGVCEKRKGKENLKIIFRGQKNVK